MKKDISANQVEPSIRLTAMEKSQKNMAQKRPEETKRRLKKGLSGHFFQRNVTKMLLTTASRRAARPVPLVD